MTALAKCGAADPSAVSTDPDTPRQLRARLDEHVDRSPFRERFEATGRFERYVAEIPSWVITAETSPALPGAAHALDLPH